MGNYFKIQQSINVNGPYKWYWSLHQPKRHMYFISQGFDTFDECIYYLKETGLEKLDILLQQLGKASVQEGRAG